MITIAVIGDSLALGLGPALYGQGLRTRVSAMLGASTTEIIDLIVGAEWQVICAGTNDAQSAHLKDNLEALRGHLGSKHVLWVLPTDSRAMAMVVEVAKTNKDRTVGFVPGRDGHHPKDYSALAASIEAIIRKG